MTANSDNEMEQTFYAAGKRGLLHCREDYCTFDVGVEQPPLRRYDSAEVEVLLQPRSTEGLPIGRPASVLRRTVRLNSLPDDRYAWARVILPRALQATVARDCYYRISPKSDDASESVGSSSCFKRNCEESS